MSRPGNSPADGKSIGAILRDNLATSGLASDLWLAGHSQVVKSDTYSVAGIGELAGRACFIKLYRFKSHLRQWLPAWGLRRPRRAYHMAHALLDAGVDVPRPLAFVRVAEGAMVVSSALPQAENLAQCSSQLTPGEQYQYLAQAGASLGQLHSSGFSHGDCKWHNLLFSQQRCYFVDLDGVRRARPGSRQQAKDFARFAVNAEEEGVSPEHFAAFVDRYVENADVPRDRFMHSVRTQARHIRARHRERYGLLGTQLL